jgi:DNA-binding transcriptional LysR family regulator
MNWDDFRYFSAIARTASVRSAAVELRVNPSTVTRRLDALERELGVLLFTRSSSGLQITAEGIEIVQRVDEVGEQLRDIESILKGKDQRLEGRIRVAVPDVLAVNYLLEDIAPFTEAYPHIDLELIPGYQNLDIAQGEVDVEIRATESPPQEMIGRPLSQVALAAYGSRQYVAQHQVMIALEGAAWVDWAAPGETLALYTEQRLAHFPGVRVHIRCDQIFMQHACIRAHMGLGILPCFIGDQDDTLMRLPHMPVLAGPTLWLLTHPDLRRARRIQVFMEFLRDVFVRRQHDLLGAYL